MARLFFLTPDALQPDGQIVFSETDTRHLISMRRQKGDIVPCIIERSEKRYKLEVMIDELKKAGNIGHIVSTEELPVTDKTGIHILQCIPKLDKMEYIIQKSAELGIESITPLLSTNTVIKGGVGDHKQTRWQAISREASIQSGRLDIMKVESPIQIGQALSNFKNADSFGIFLNEYEKEKSLHDLANKIEKARTIYLLTGAEGGFTPEEAIHIQEIGFLSVTLGDRILRAETAPIATSAILSYMRGNI